MENVRDNRDNTNWPCLKTKISSKQIVVTMAGVNGYNQVTQGRDGTGNVIVNNNMYAVALPGLTSHPGTFEVTFKRLP